MRATTVIIGAGQAGLAMSRCLAERSIDHVLLERGEVANSWKKERWDSLKLLTPNWQSRLPGYRYEGDDPDGYRTMPETISFLERYAEVVSAPVSTGTTVRSIDFDGGGYRVATDQGEWRTRTVVLATGACAIPLVPAVAEALPRGMHTLTTAEYRNPDQLPEGGAMVVGASASGVQLAEEIHLSGRPVTLSVGEHIRAPRLYRGKDIEWWMDRAGVLDQRYDEVDDIERARRVPSLQLVGSDARKTIDLNALSSLGINLVGRLANVRGGKAQFSGSLKNLGAMSDLKMNRLLDTFDEWATANGLDGEVEPPHRFEPTRVDASPPLEIDLAGRGIRTILWATGFRPDHGFVKLPVFDRKGRMRHDGGVVDAPGMYLLGMPFLRRRKSSLIDGVGADARDLSAHLAAYLDGRTTRSLLAEAV